MKTPARADPSQLRTVVTFRSDAFNTTQSKDYFINPHSYGDDVARWLMRQLQEQGMAVDREPKQEDFGWYFQFDAEGVTHRFVIGLRPDDDTWIGWIERPAGKLKSLFGGDIRGIRAEAVRAVHRALQSGEEIDRILWHRRQDFDAGLEQEGRLHPAQG